VARDGGEMRRVEVGFNGGQVILMRLNERAHDQLRRAVQEGKQRWYEVETIDGIVGLDLGQISFLKLETAEHRVGFSGL
jgi:hypothetical protein